MHIPDKHLLVVRRTEWSQCAFVPKYEVLRGPAEYEPKTGPYMRDREDVTLLAPGASTEADEAEVAEDWSEMRFKRVEVMNRDGEPVIKILDQGALERID